MLYVKCFRSGELIITGERPPQSEGSIVLAKASKRADELRQHAEVNARQSYTPGELLVPGIPEADGDEAAFQAMMRFKKLLQMRMDGKKGFPQ